MCQGPAGLSGAGMPYRASLRSLAPRPRCGLSGLVTAALRRNSNVRYTQKPRLSTLPRHEPAPRVHAARPHYITYFQDREGHRSYRSADTYLSSPPGSRAEQSSVMTATLLRRNRSWFRQRRRRDKQYRRAMSARTACLWSTKAGEHSNGPPSCPYNTFILGRYVRLHGARQPFGLRFAPAMCRAPIPAYQDTLQAHFQRRTVVNTVSGPLSRHLYKLQLLWLRLLWPHRCRYCHGPLDAEDLRCILMCEACCRAGRDLR
jgi:hypothetical protein